MDYILEEKEEKYLIDEIKKTEMWEKEHIIYQWYIENSAIGSVKEKIIFDILSDKIIYVRVQKRFSGWGSAEKKIEYLNINSFSINEKLGVPFVLKRRAIKQKHFLDHFIISNGICEYLLEIEDDDQENYKFPEYKIIQNVTQDSRYYNQNMCVPFEKKDAEYLQFLLSVF